MRVYTCVYDELTKIPGSISQVEEIDNEDFLIVRDNEIIEVWNIKNHVCKKSIKILGQKSMVTALKQQHGLFFVYYTLSNNSLNILDSKSKKVIKNYAVGPLV